MLTTAKNFKLKCKICEEVQTKKHCKFIVYYVLPGFAFAVKKLSFQLANQGAFSCDVRQAAGIAHSFSENQLKI